MVRENLRYVEPSYCLLLQIEKVDNGPRSKEAFGVAGASRTPMR